MMFICISCAVMIFFCFGVWVGEGWLLLLRAHPLVKNRELATKNAWDEFEWIDNDDAQ